jgi:vacuolar iron transporter family protein
MEDMRHEYQLKIKGGVEPSVLIELGADPLGKVSQQDIYLAGQQTRRIRREGDQYIFAEKRHAKGNGTRVKEVAEDIISRAETDKLVRQFGVRAIVNKNRSLYRLNETVIAVDDVEYLGEFTELQSVSEQELFMSLEKLGLHKKDVFEESYLDLILAKKLSPFLQFVLRVHDKIGELTFGITSGILTTIGILVGVNSATSSRLSVIAAIATIAVADSASDAFGMYLSRLSERGATPGQALRHASGTFLGKFFLPFTFMLPILLLPLSSGVWVALAWGFMLLTLLAAEQAMVTQKPVVKNILRITGLAVGIVLVSYITGRLIASFENLLSA